jgi:hypothetical protein
VEGAGRKAAAGAVVDGEGGAVTTGTDTAGSALGACAVVVGCGIRAGATTLTGSTTGAGARAVADAIGKVGAVGVPAPSNAGLTRKGGSGSAAADPAAKSSIGNKAGLSCPRREDDMPNQCVGATSATSH